MLPGIQRLPTLILPPTVPAALVSLSPPSVPVPPSDSAAEAAAACSLDIARLCFRLPPALRAAIGGNGLGSECTSVGLQTQSNSGGHAAKRRRGGRLSRSECECECTCMACVCGGLKSNNPTHSCSILTIEESAPAQ